MRSSQNGRSNSPFHLCSQQVFEKCKRWQPLRVVPSHLCRVTTISSQELILSNMDRYRNTPKYHRAGTGISFYASVVVLTEVRKAQLFTVGLGILKNNTDICKKTEELKLPGSSYCSPFRVAPDMHREVERAREPECVNKRYGGQNSR